MIERSPTAVKKLLAGLIVGLVAAALAGCAARVGPDGVPLTLDQRIRADVVRILESDDDIVAADLIVESTDGVVIVSGVQESMEPLGDALQRIARVRGVVEVVNRIRIIRGRSPVGLSRPRS